MQILLRAPYSASVPLMTTRSTLLLVLISVAISACQGFSGITIKPQPPENSTGYISRQERSETILNLPVNLSIETLQSVLNAEIPQTFAGTKNDPTDVLSDDDLSYQINRSAIGLDIENNKITFSIPISGTARIEGNINARLVQIPISSNAEVVGTISGDFYPELDSQWNLEPNLNVSADLTRAEIAISDITISIRTVLQEQLEKAIAREQPQFISQVINQLDIKGKVEKTWNDLHLLQQINKAPSIWVKIEPQRIAFQPFDLGDGETIKSGIAIEMFVETCICETVSAINLKPFPNLDIENAIANKFLIHLPVQASFEELNKTLQSEISGKSFTIAENTQLTINNINVSTSGQKIVAKVDFNAEQDNFMTGAKGVLYLLGNMVYDRQAQALQVVDLDYDINTKNELVKAANWLVKNTLLKQIEKRLSFPLDRELEKAKAIANNYLQTLKLPSEINADIEVEDLKIDRILAANNNLYLILLSQGNMSATLDF